MIHHTNCGMETFTDEVMRSLLRQNLDTAQLEADRWHDLGSSAGSSEGDFIDWHTIKSSGGQRHQRCATDQVASARSRRCADLWLCL